jgi:hypothetical protein
MLIAPASAACPKLGGTFLQLTDAQVAWPATNWRQLIDELRSIGIGNLFVQWTVLDRKAFFSTVKFDTSADTPLPLIFRLAAQSGIRGWIGLALDPHYWEAIKQGPDLLQPYFRQRLRELEGFLGDLNAATAGAPFGGWYIPDEIDDRTWLPPEKREILVKYLADTVSLLRARRPRSRVAISGFSNSFADPDLLASFWAEVITGSGIDLLLFQDGIGEGKVALEDIPLYYGPLNDAVRRAGAELGAVVELFSLMPNGRRVPAMIGRIIQQLRLAERLTNFAPVAFSVPEYMSNLAGPSAGRLLSNFLEVRKRCSG